MSAPVALRLPPSKLAQRVDRTRSYSVVDEARRIVRVTDLDFAAYVLEKGVAIIDAYEANAHERVFDFWDPRSEIPKISLEFVNSETARVLDCVRRLKKVTYVKPQGWDPWQSTGG